MQRVMMMAAALVAMTLATPAMAHPGHNTHGQLHECRIMAKWDAPASSWGLPECNTGQKDTNDSNDRRCYCYQFRNSAVGQANHEYGDGTEGAPAGQITECWKDRSAHISNRICSR